MDPKALFTTRLLGSLLNEIVVDTALDVHSSVKRSKLNADSVSAANGTKTDYYSNNPLFECLVCSRQVSSNRYATHLEKCMGMGVKMSRKGSARNAKTSSNATNARLLSSTPVPESPSLKSAALPRKRAASPTSLRANGSEKQAKVDRTSTPSGAAKEQAKSEGVRTTERGEKPSAGSSGAHEGERKDSGSQRTAPATRAASTEAGTGDQAEDLDLSDDADFPSGFSVSSDSGNSETNEGASDAENGAGNEDTMEEVVFDLDEVEDDSDNDEDIGEVDIDAELEDSDENDNHDDV
ncbi:hypothetical protein MBRA1_002840 [Malassezia brasiliensis]|uniref:SAGA-associated factor 11 n=1 Tax=Malassezia brasiliensis TaxID=1821822 RepID=A0AAF0DUV9_9BASI|nr:hypothetical protein MBRA1_002840 [Malassezia brasiliensis]